MDKIIMIIHPLNCSNNKNKFQLFKNQKRKHEFPGKHAPPSGYPLVGTLAPPHNPHSRRRSPCSRRRSSPEPELSPTPATALSSRKTLTADPRRRSSLPRSPPLVARSPPLANNSRHSTSPPNSGHHHRRSPIAYVRSHVY